MSLFLFFWVVYIIIGASLIPMFTRDAYKQILAKRNIEYPNASKNNQLVALQQCRTSGIGRAATWPISLPLHFSLMKIAKELEIQNKKELEAAETARILKEYTENDPATKAFRELEEEEKRKKELEQRKKDEASMMAQLDALNEKIDNLPKQLNLPKSIQEAYAQSGPTGQYYTGNGVYGSSSFDDDIIEVRNFDGSIAVRYSTLEPITKAEADGQIEQARREINKINKLVEQAREKVLNHEISVKHYEILMYQYIDRLTAITNTMNKVRARIESNRAENNI